MKDPLHNTTPYDLLGVAPGISEAEINKAFLQAIGARKLPPHVAKNARDSLLNPAKRALVGLTFYREDFCRQMLPNPLEDSAVLGSNARAATAAAWERHLRATLPNLAATHCLAVLWYWWTRHEQARFDALLAACAKTHVLEAGAVCKTELLRRLQAASENPCDPASGTRCPRTDCCWRQDCLCSAPPLEQMWHKTIAYWAALAMAPEFWRGLDGVSPANLDQVRNEFLDGLRNELLEHSQRFTSLLDAAVPDRDGLEQLAGVTPQVASALRTKGITSIRDVVRAGSAQLAPMEGIGPVLARRVLKQARQHLADRDVLPQQYRTLHLVLETELTTAQAMLRVGVRTNRGKMPYGSLMLGFLNQLESMRSIVAQTLEANPSGKLLQDLYDALSPYCTVSVLIANQKPEAALAAIAVLPAVDRDSEEVRRLKARALFLQGRQAATLAQMEEALDCWAEALKYTKASDGLREKIRTELTSSCHQQACSLQSHHLDRAIQILKLALEVIEDDRLRSTLAEMLNKRANQRFAAIHRGADHRPRRLGREQLGDLQSILQDLQEADRLGCANAAASAQRIQEMIEEAQGGLGSLPDDARDLVEQANEAAGRKDWQATVKLLRAALSKAGSEPPAELRKILSISLSNLGNERCQQALDQISAVRDKADVQVKALLASASGDPTCCAVCGVSRFARPGNWYDLTLSSGQRSSVCELCMHRVRAAEAAGKQLDPAAVSLLQAGEQDLAAAVQYDANNNVAQQNLQDIHKIMEQLQVQALSRPAPKKSTERPSPTPPRPAPCQPEARRSAPSTPKPDAKPRPKPPTPAKDIAPQPVSGGSRTLCLLMILAMLGNMAIALLGCSEDYARWTRAPLGQIGHYGAALTMVFTGLMILGTPAGISRLDVIRGLFWYAGPKYVGPGIRLAQVAMCVFLVLSICALVDG